MRSDKITQSFLENLTRRAKREAKELGLPLHAARDKLARELGYEDWREMQAIARRFSPADAVLKLLRQNASLQAYQIEDAVALAAKGRVAIFNADWGTGVTRTLGAWVALKRASTPGAARGGGQTANAVGQEASTPAALMVVNDEALLLPTAEDFHRVLDCGVRLVGGGVDETFAHPEAPGSVGAPGVVLTTYGYLTTHPWLVSSMPWSGVIAADLEMCSTETFNGARANIFGENLDGAPLGEAPIIFCGLRGRRPKGYAALVARLARECGGQYTDPSPAEAERLFEKDLAERAEHLMGAAEPFIVTRMRSDVMDIPPVRMGKLAVAPTKFFKPAGDDRREAYDRSSLDLGRQAHSILASLGWLSEGPCVIVSFTLPGVTAAAEALVREGAEVSLVISSLSEEQKTARIQDFKEGKTRYLVAHADSLGIGLSLTNAWRLLVLGQQFTSAGSFARSIERVICRLRRFGQSREVDVMFARLETPADGRFWDDFERGPHALSADDIHPELETSRRFDDAAHAYWRMGGTLSAIFDRLVRGGFCLPDGSPLTIDFVRRWLVERGYRRG